MTKYITKKVLKLCTRHLQVWTHFTFCAISKLPEAHPASVFLVLIIFVLKQNHLSTRYFLVSVHRHSISEQLILFSLLERSFSVLGSPPRPITSLVSWFCATGNYQILGNLTMDKLLKCSKKTAHLKQDWKILLKQLSYIPNKSLFLRC